MLLLLVIQLKFCYEVKWISFSLRSNFATCAIPLPLLLHSFPPPSSQSSPPHRIMVTGRWQSSLLTLLPRPYHVLPLFHILTLKNAPLCFLVCSHSTTNHGWPKKCTPLRVLWPLLSESDSNCQSERLRKPMVVICPSIDSWSKFTRHSHPHVMLGYTLCFEERNSLDWSYLFHSQFFPK